MVRRFLGILLNLCLDRKLNLPKVAEKKNSVMKSNSVDTPQNNTEQQQPSKPPLMSSKSKLVIFFEKIRKK